MLTSCSVECQTLRGSRWKSALSPLPISIRQVHCASLAVNGLPSCQVTPCRSLKVSLVLVGSQDQLSASFPETRHQAHRCWRMPSHAISNTRRPNRLTIRPAGRARLVLLPRELGLDAPLKLAISWPSIIRDRRGRGNDLLLRSAGAGRPGHDRRHQDQCRPRQRLDLPQAAYLQQARRAHHGDRQRRQSRDQPVGAVDPDRRASKTRTPANSKP